MEDGPICRVRVSPAAGPVFVKSKDGDEFFVRLHNSTRRLDVRDALEYVKSHWS
jgi:hypothetical protein